MNKLPPSFKKYRIPATLLVLAALILLGLLLHYYAHMPAYRALGIFCSCTGIWLCLWQLFVYVDIYRHGARGTGRLISSKTPFFTNLRMDAWNFGGGRLNLARRKRPIVQFEFGDELLELEIMGYFGESPTAVGAELEIIYWDAYPKKVITAHKHNLQEAIVASVFLCLLLGLALFFYCWASF